MCVYANMWLCVQTWRPEILDSLELELQVQLQGTELRSSEEQKMYLTLYPSKKPQQLFCALSVCDVWYQTT